MKVIVDKIQSTISFVFLTILICEVQRICLLNKDWMLRRQNTGKCELKLESKLVKLHQYFFKDYCLFLSLLCLSCLFPCNEMKYGREILFDSSTFVVR